MYQNAAWHLLDGSSAIAAADELMGDVVSSVVSHHALSSHAEGWRKEGMKQGKQKIKQKRNKEKKNWGVTCPGWATMLPCSTSPAVVPAAAATAAVTEAGAVVCLLPTVSVQNPVTHMERGTGWERDGWGKSDNKPRGMWEGKVQNKDEKVGGGGESETQQEEGSKGGEIER